MLSVLSRVLTVTGCTRRYTFLPHRVFACTACEVASNLHLPHDNTPKPDAGCKHPRAITPAHPAVSELTCHALLSKGDTHGRAGGRGGGQACARLHPSTHTPTAPSQFTHTHTPDAGFFGFGAKAKAAEVEEEEEEEEEDEPVVAKKAGGFFGFGAKPVQVSTHSECSL